MCKIIQIYENMIDWILKNVKIKENFIKNKCQKGIPLGGPQGLGMVDKLELQELSEHRSQRFTDGQFYWNTGKMLKHNCII